jgi:membrane fusion protein (multidrug efflux system)
VLDHRLHLGHFMQVHMRDQPNVITPLWLFRHRQFNKRFSKLYKNRKISIEKFENVKTAFFALQNEINADKKTLESMYEDKNALLIKLKLAENNKKEIKRLSKIIDSMKSQLKAMDEKLALINQHIKDSLI